MKKVVRSSDFELMGEKVQRRCEQLPRSNKTTIERRGPCVYGKGKFPHLLGAVVFPQNICLGRTRNATFVERKGHNARS